MGLYLKGVAMTDMTAMKSASIELTDEKIETIARTCHEVNRALCIAFGDNTQRPWDESPDWQIKSCIEGVKHSSMQKYQSPRESHDCWMELKLREGWRYGPQKCAEKKEHPCLLPFDELPIEQQLKDVIFVNIVEMMVKKYTQ